MNGTDRPDQTVPPLRGAATVGSLPLPPDRALVRELGHGRWGRVCLVRDPAGAERVLKLFARTEHATHEWRLLQRADGAGLVRALGRELGGSCPWIELERLDGPLFPPGLSVDEVIRRGAGLALALARVHARGVVHRDVKPDNAMLRAGEPVLLDPGVGAFVGEVPDPSHGPGTPRFAAPEQGQDGPAHPAADVYALGQTLCAVLAEAQGLPDPGRDPDPEGAGLSSAVAAVLRAMLRTSPEARPTAREVAARLNGAPLPDDSPFLGDPAWLDALEPEAGGVLVLGGVPGSGRSRALRARALQRPAAWIFAGDRPFSSLFGLLGDPPHATDEAAVLAWIRDRLTEVRAPLMADDWDRIDPESRALLLERPPPGGLVRVVQGPALLTVPPLRPSDLRALFVGAERVLHLPTDAAEELWRRSGGNPGRVYAVLRVWERHALVERVGERYAISPAQLAKLRAGEDPPTGEAPAARGPAEDDLLHAISLAGDHARPDVLAALLRRPLWELERMLRRMEAAGLVGSWQGRWLARVTPTGSWSPERLRGAQERMARALEPGVRGATEARIAAGLWEGLAPVAMAEAEALEREGEPRRAGELLRAALKVLPRHEDLRARLVHALLQQRALVSDDEARQLAAPAPELADLVEAVLAARRGQGARALPRLRALCFADPALEMLRLASLVDATIDAPLSERVALLDELATLPLVRDHADHLARWRTWRALAHYAAREFARAGALHELAALRTGRVGRLSSLSNAASAYLEAADHDNARRLALETLRLSREARSARFEAEGEWVLRALANRAGESVPDEDLVACVRLVASPVLLGKIALTEAFIGHRGDDPRALGWAETAERALASILAAKVHAAALAHALGAPRDHAALRAQLWAMREEHPVTALDGLCLLGPPYPGAPEAIEALLERIPPASRGLSIGRYSPAEAVARMLAHKPDPGS